MTTEEARERLVSLQAEIAQAGWYSALWRQGEHWHLVASTEPEYVRGQIALRPMDIPIEAVRYRHAESEEGGR